MTLKDANKVVFTHIYAMIRGKLGVEDSKLLALAISRLKVGSNVSEGHTDKALRDVLRALAYGQGVLSSSRKALKEYEK